MDKDKPTSKLRKTAKGVRIAVKVVLTLGGIALMLFLAWLGMSFYDRIIGGGV